MDAAVSLSSVRATDINTLNSVRQTEVQRRHNASRNNNLDPVLTEMVFY
jgi:hypothetical protein